MSIELGRECLVHTLPGNQKFFRRSPVILAKTPMAEFRSKWHIAVSNGTDTIAYRMQLIQNLVRTALLEKKETLAKDMQAILSKAQIDDEEEKKFFTLIDSIFPTINQNDIENVTAFFEHKTSSQLENCFKKLEKGTFKTEDGKIKNRKDKMDTWCFESQQAELRQAYAYLDILDLLQYPE